MHRTSQTEGDHEVKKTKLIFFVSVTLYVVIWSGFLFATRETKNEDQPRNNPATSNDDQDSSIPQFEILEEEPIAILETINDETQVVPATRKVPPGKPPKDVVIGDELEITNCWDATGFPRDKNSCGELAALEGVINERLYVADQCRKQIVGNYASGRLDLGMELDFEGSALSFWSKPSSRLPSSSEVAACLSTELKGLPLSELNPKFARYHVSMTLSFGLPGVENKPAVKEVGSAAPQVAPEGATNAVDEGRIVSVIKDRVRIRKKPIDGEILGKINSGNRVILLGESDGWCNVKTPRNVGWMVCWALAL